MRIDCNIDAWYEAITSARERLHVLRILRRIADRFSNVSDRARQRVFGNVDVGPEMIEQLVLGDDRSGTCGEVREDLDETRRQIHTSTCVRQRPGPRIDLERSKAEHALGILLAKCR